MRTGSLHRRVRVPRVACWSAALASGWLAIESAIVFPNAPGLMIGVAGMLIAVALALESGRRLDSAPPVFQTFWVLLSAIVLPIVIAIVLLTVNAALDAGSDAPLTALMFWLILHVPFVLCLQNVDRSVITLLTIVQWATITGFASHWVRAWRSYEAVAFTAATILVIGIVSLGCLLLLGYRLPFVDM